MYGNAHYLSYMLDPRFIEEGLPRGNRLQWTEFVIAAEQEKAEDLTRFKMLANGAKTVLQYWLVDGKGWPDLGHQTFQYGDVDCRL
ncbi:hypothetical protein AXG93_593s1250 [Marchantia polymorpha subsp. ruderalis]|uniref:Uncharacterized protein n=1 Tax=Marchantia polymorpha subsp. ruderalis TaxID=1480154 RepID=A0A176WPC0_MARPO|nr:hypothetical protein AXG93_593s1250 [Marchantia polymorpha subsp. ruderalis]